MTLPLAELLDYTTLLPTGAGEDLAFDLTATLIRGPRVVQEWVVREWVAEPGSLRWAPERGLGLLRWENASLDGAEVGRRRLLLAQAARRVDYVHPLTDVSLRVVRRRLVIDADLVLVDGGKYPFEVTIDEAAKLFARFA